MSLSTAIMSEIDRQAKKSGIPDLALEPFQLDAIFKGATAIGAWDELTKLYLEELPSGKAPRLYARMQELIS